MTPRSTLPRDRNINDIHAVLTDIEKALVRVAIVLENR